MGIYEFLPDDEEIEAAQKDARKTELRAKLKVARESYYNGEPTISDDEYDALRDELRDLDANDPEVTAIGAAPEEVSEWKKVSHGIPMASLDKVNTLEEMSEWISKNANGQWLLVTEKLDGISIHVRYEDGQFVQAITRGDGSVGEDITKNVALMKGIVKKLPDNTFTGSLRGEIILTKGDFERYFSDKANTRNAAGGCAKRYDGQRCEHLTVMFYEIVDANTTFATEEEQFQFLESLGFKTPWWVISMMAPGQKTPQDHYVEYQTTKRVQLDYDIDGLVVRLNDLSKQHALGQTDGGNPKGAVAFKFAPISRETTIRKILRQTGGTGRITPVAVFDAVRIMGAEITQASLYNWSYISDLKLDVGCRALVSRANDVIPRVTMVLKESGTVNAPPTNCDDCGAETVREGEYVVCPNKSGCPAQVEGRIQAWISTLNILEWGDVLIQKLCRQGLVKTPADLYRMTPGQLAALDRMGERSALNVLKTLHDRNPVPLDQFIGGLSIPMIGASMVRMVMEAGYDTLPALQVATYEQLEAVHGLGPAKARSLYSGLRASEALINDLLSVGVKIKEKVVGVLNGMSFCFTGKMVNKRPLLEQMVKDNGGSVKASVGKGLTYLVIADPSGTSSKATAAKKHGTKCISEEDFLAMVKG